MRQKQKPLNLFLCRDVLIPPIDRWKRLYMRKGVVNKHSDIGRLRSLLLELAESQTPISPIK